MRIAYVARWDVSHESGILKKMVSQMRTWRSRGHEVTFFALTPGDRVWGGIESLQVRAFHRDGLWTRLTWRGHVHGPILANRPDIVYLRFSTWYPALEKVMEQVPSAVEINGDDITENRLSLPRPLYWAHRLTRGRLLKRAWGMVYVSRELSHLPQFAKYGAPTLVLGNGIAFDGIANAPAAGAGPPRMVFVGYSDCAWHGLDKLPVLARAFPDWQVHVVGSSRGPDDRSPPQNLIFHGQLERAAYERILRSAHVAIGTLALHRKQMEEASPLKTREYLAYGIPTIIAYDDTDFPGGHELLLRLPNTPDNVETHLDEIRDFVERARGARIPRADVAHLDIEEKEDVRLAFLARVLSGEAAHP